MNTTWVLVADDASVGNLLELAHGVGAPTAVLVVGPRELADRIAEAGEQVHWLDTSAAPVAALAGAAAAHVADAPVGAVLAGNGPNSRPLAARVAAATGADVLADVTSVAVEGDEVVAGHLLYGGLVEEKVASSGPLVLVADAHGEPEAGAAGAVTPVTGTAAPVTRVAVEPNRARTTDLRSAPRVVGAGRGFRSEADLAMVRDLATVLGAEVACSRPLAEGMAWMPADRYLGISGARVAPALYVAVGISGQAQHMIGVRDAGVIVAVNSDPAAPIVTQADWTLVGDLYAVLPELTAAFEAAS